MKHMLAVMVAVVFLLIMVLSIAGAEVADEIVLWGSDKEKPPAQAAGYNPTSADVATDNSLFFVIRAPAVGYTVAEREAVVLRRLIEVYSNGPIGPVYVDEVRGLPTVYVGKYRIVSVYPEDVAAVGGGSARALAERWAALIREGLENTAPSSTLNGPPRYSVSCPCGRRVLFRLFDQVGHRSLRARGEAIKRELARIMVNFDPKAVGTAPNQYGVAVTYRGGWLVTATPLDARCNQAASPQALAEAWAENLRRCCAGDP